MRIRLKDDIVANREVTKSEPAKRKRTRNIHVKPSPPSVQEIENLDLHEQILGALLTYDRLFNANLGKITRGISPAALGYAFMDWWLQLLKSPGKQAELAYKAQRKVYRFSSYTARSMMDPNCACCITPLPQDARFDSKAWNSWPYNYIYQSFLLTQQWWDNATTDVRGVSSHHTEVVTFTMRQIIDMLSPSNFVSTNPDVRQTTHATGGTNIIKGALNYLEDAKREFFGEPPVGAEGYRPGRTVAITPGKIVYKNRLIELIQYHPTTKTVHPEPVLITPAWIMKFYILDLSPHNSLVRYIVDRGYTVFMISWKNPEKEDHDLGMEDYRNLGIMSALDAIEAIRGSSQESTKVTSSAWRGAHINGLRGM